MRLTRSRVFCRSFCSADWSASSSATSVGRDVSDRLAAVSQCSPAAYHYWIDRALPFNTVAVLLPALALCTNVTFHLQWASRDLAAVRTRGNAPTAAVGVRHDRVTKPALIQHHGISWILQSKLANSSPSFTSSVAIFRRSQSGTSSRRTYRSTSGSGPFAQDRRSCRAAKRSAVH